MKTIMILSVLLLTGCGTIDKGRNWLSEHIATRDDYDVRLLCDVVSEEGSFGDEYHCVKVN